MNIYRKFIIHIYYINFISICRFILTPARYTAFISYISKFMDYF
uniref:Uncharacterized protein n=1 Tax=Podoviridae sp. ct8Lf7 TaxID=2827723 RepID=A0A8S5S0I3_9CAUD|nr:MAG TPA: hypothetical protein [Podoviridae sp. ct8Lf7]